MGVAIFSEITQCPIIQLYIIVYMYVSECNKCMTVMESGTSMTMMTSDTSVTMTESDTSVISSDGE